MKVKKRIFAGTTCDQIIYSTGRGNPKGRARLRFKSETERAEHRRMIARRHHAALINANFSPAGYYCTFTFSAENEVHTMDDARRERANFRRRLLYKCKTAKISIYIGRGKSTHRIHFHAFIEGINKADIEKAWTGGGVIQISNLRRHNKNAAGMDVGTDFTAVANYCFDHWTAEQGGHYYSRSNNFVMPDEEEARECKREYSPEHPPKAPKGYTFVSAYTTPYGYQAYHYVILPHKRTSEKQQT